MTGCVVKKKKMFTMLCLLTASFALTYVIMLRGGHGQDAMGRGEDPARWRKHLSGRGGGSSGRSDDDWRRGEQLKGRGDDDWRRGEQLKGRGEDLWLRRKDPKVRTAEPKWIEEQRQTSDGWPEFSKPFFKGPIPPSPFHPNFPLRWNYDTSEFFKRHDVLETHPAKLITWMVKTRYMPPLPEPVRMRVCPEMPCRMTTNFKRYQNESAALLWAGQIMREPAPPARSHPDQVFVFHNHEPQSEDWIYQPSFRLPAWKSAFNWTMHYRFDADITALYGQMIERDTPLSKNYTAILAKKTKFAAWLVSHCPTSGQRMKYVSLLRKYITVDAYGTCGPKRCPRNADDGCFDMINSEYKFYLAFENALCKDYISEKLFRNLEADVVVVGRASNEYRNHVPSNIFVNTADFKSAKELAEYLLYLDRNPEEYVKMLKAKDRFLPLYEDWPIRHGTGEINYMHYHYEAVAYCELCRRLWDLDQHRKNIPDIMEWFNKGNCYPPTDIV